MLATALGRPEWSVTKSAAYKLLVTHMVMLWCSSDRRRVRCREDLLQKLRIIAQIEHRADRTNRPHFRRTSDARYSLA